MDPRRRLLAFAATLAVITYVDRVCIAQAAPLMEADLKLSKVQIGWAMSIFPTSKAVSYS